MPNGSKPKKWIGSWTRRCILAAINDKNGTLPSHDVCARTHAAEHDVHPQPLHLQAGVLYHRKDHQVHVFTDPVPDGCVVVSHPLKWI